MARKAWNPNIQISTQEVNSKDFQFLIDEVARIIYKNICQRHQIKFSQNPISSPAKEVAISTLERTGTDG